MQILQSTSYWNMETPCAVDFTKKNIFFFSIWFLKKIKYSRRVLDWGFFKEHFKKVWYVLKKKLGGNIHGIFILPCRRAQFFVFNTRQ